MTRIISGSLSRSSVVVARLEPSLARRPLDLPFSLSSFALRERPTAAFSRHSSEADVLSIHLVLGDRSRGLVGPNDLASMKPSAFLINTSRGPIVDEAALVDALRSGTLAGAGLDVFDREPLPDGHPLRELENTVLTPHLGYVTRETYDIFYRHALENILGYLRGTPLRDILA